MTKLAIGRDNNPGGARWCEEHTRLECTRNRNRGRGICHCQAIRGTNACYIHGGKVREMAKAEGQATISAWNAMGWAERPVTAPMAVLSVLQMSWLRLATYSELLRQQVAKEADHADDPAEDDYPQASGLIGFHYGAAGKNGTIYVQSEAIRALVDLEARERDRVVKYAETAHKMGISERLTQMAERWGDMVAEQVSAMFEALELTPEQAVRVPTLIQRYLGSIDMEELGGGVSIQSLDRDRG